MAEELINFDLPADRSSMIKVLGVGGGGGNAVNHMFEMGIKDVNFIVCNTDSQALVNSPVPVKVQLGETLTEGRGAGNKPEIGKQAAIESLDDVTECLKANTKMVFITAGLGGGTGTGAAPVIAKATKEMGILTVAIVTIPFRFEGQLRINQAINGIREIRQHVDSLLVINNEKLREVFGNLRLSDAFSKADNVLTSAAKGIAEIITVHGHVNVDFADVQTVMTNSGVALLGSGAAEGENRAVKAIQEAISSPLLNNNDIRGAKNILLNIASGSEEVSMDEIGDITDYVTNETAANTNIIWGTCSDVSLNKALSVTIIATGFESGTIPELYKEKNKSEKIPLEDTPLNEKDRDADQPVSPADESIGDTSPELEFKVKQKEIEFDIEDNYNRQTEESEKEETGSYKPVDETTAGNRLQKLKEAQSKLRDKKYLNINEKEEIDELEDQPAYKRKKIDISVSGFSNDCKVSRYTLSDSDEEGPKIRPDNSYLHDNVD